jgi:hypothetical protein
MVFLKNNNFIMGASVKQIAKKLSVRHKNNKFLYYAINFTRQLFPGKIFQSRLKHKLSAIKEIDMDYISERVDYYNKLEKSVDLSDSVTKLRNFKMKKKNKTYFFDSYEYTRYFDPDLRMDYKFGDVTFVPDEPAIVKSRPIHGDNSNSVLLNLDKVRHFTFINDRKDFREKKNMLVSRNYVRQPHRLKFLEMYIDHPMCNIGKINKNDGHENLLREIMTFDEQLDYKFILCLEGHDVASNLKWVMSSQSLAVMPVPKYETWFMEGKLIPNHHYMLIKDDYSDLEERMVYYLNHTDEALEIIRNAHRYIENFKNKRREDLISLLVLKKYFSRTNQM